MDNSEQKIVNKVSPQFLTSGLLGMFNSDLYKSVEVTIAFHKTHTSKKEASKTNVQQTLPGSQGSPKPCPKWEDDSHCYMDEKYNCGNEPCILTGTASGS